MHDFRSGLCLAPVLGREDFPNHLRQTLTLTLVWPLALVRVRRRREFLPGILSSIVPLVACKYKS